MKNMEKYFGEQLAKFEVAPPADLWHKISDRLDRQEVLSEMPKAKTVWFTRERWLRAAAVAVLLIGVESIIHFYSNNAAQTATSSVKNNEATPQKNTANEVLPTEPAALKTTVAQTEKPHAESTSHLAENKPEKAINNIEISGEQKAVAHNSTGSPTREEVVIAPVSQVAVVENKEEQAASEFVTTINDKATSVSSNSVPVYSLKWLDKDVPVNDEITVIDPKAKKVIIIGKGIKKPQIDYSTPKRF